MRSSPKLRQRTFIQGLSAVTTPVEAGINLSSAATYSSRVISRFLATRSTRLETTFLRLRLSCLRNQPKPPNNGRLINTTTQNPNQSPARPASNSPRPQAPHQLILASSAHVARKRQQKGLFWATNGSVTVVRRRRLRRLPKPSTPKSPQPVSTLFG